MNLKDHNNTAAKILGLDQPITNYATKNNVNLTQLMTEYRRIDHTYGPNELHKAINGQTTQLRYSEIRTINLVQILREANDDLIGAMHTIDRMHKTEEETENFVQKVSEIAAESDNSEEAIYNMGCDCGWKISTPNLATFQNAAIEHIESHSKDAK